ncbi:hypothetical protein [Streptomyces sp. NBC_01602]|uniref:hypothetical protein n=1 Tax=Streptomyces sp. NBC_01602 TaxID=2975893 RepID=UPI0038669A8E
MHASTAGLTPSWGCSGSQALRGFRSEPDPWDGGGDGGDWGGGGDADGGEGGDHGGDGGGDWPGDGGYMFGDSPIGDYWPGDEDGDRPIGDH